MDPILVDFPDCIETDRLVLRCARPGDGAAVNEAVVETLEDLQPYVAWAQGAPTRDASEIDVRRIRGKFLLRQDLPMLMFERDATGTEGLYVGGTGLHRIDWAARRFEIGYWCRRSRQGRGYVLEAVNALSRFAFDALGARRIEIRMDDRNDRSWRVAERAGFVLEGVLRQYTLAPSGGLCDTRVYAQVRGIEFEASGDA